MSNDETDPVNPNSLSYISIRKTKKMADRHTPTTYVGDETEMANIQYLSVVDDSDDISRKTAKNCEKLPFSNNTRSRISFCTEVCCRGVCGMWKWFTSMAGLFAFFMCLVMLVFLLYVHLRVEHELAAKTHSFRYALHMYAVDVRPPLFSGDGDAMAHGWIDFNERDLSVCYKLITTNFSLPLTSLSVHGPLWSMEPEFIEATFLVLKLPNDMDEDNLYTACMPAVDAYVFTAIKGDPSMYYVVATNNATKHEAARSYLYGLM